MLIRGSSQERSRVPLRTSRFGSRLLGKRLEKRCRCGDVLTRPRKTGWFRVVPDYLTLHASRVRSSAARAVRRLSDATELGLHLVELSPLPVQFGLHGEELEKTCLYPFFGSEYPITWATLRA